MGPPLGTAAARVGPDDTTAEDARGRAFSKPRWLRGFEKARACAGLQVIDQAADGIVGGWDEGRALSLSTGRRGVE